MSDREPAAGSRAPEEDVGLPASNINWPLLYAAVLGELALLVAIFHAFTKAFA